MYLPQSDALAPPAVYRERTTPVSPLGPPAEPLSVDVAVIGAGFTGLSAALHLAEAGSRVAVLEARGVGWGASGRAFGQVVPYLKRDHAAVLAHYGAAVGARVVDAVAAGPAFVFGLIERHAIACDDVRTGLLFGAHSPAGARGLEVRAKYWQGRGAAVELLDAAQTEAASGSRFYELALLDRRGGHLNPYAYTHGLARAALGLGVAIHVETPVRTIARGSGRWRLDAGAGVEADAVIIATNAYGRGLWPGLAESVVPMRGHGMVSRPISDNLRRSVLPGGQPLTDTRRLYSGLRLLPGGGLQVSLTGPPAGPERSPPPAAADARVARVFPHLGKLEWSEQWSGWVAMTPDMFPRVNELAPGLFAGLGYNGRGIAAASMIGRELALRVAGAPESELTFPLTPLRPVPAYRLAQWPLRAAAAASGLLDALDEARLNRRQRARAASSTALRRPSR
jgi:glycine/D-amino acid oxidase-like deaminating enzyme